MPRSDQCKLRLDSKDFDWKQNRMIKNKESTPADVRLTGHLDGLTCVEAANVMLSIMNQDDITSSTPRPNSQSYCLVATALQHGNNTGSQLGTDLFRSAIKAGVATDSRFVNAVLRCFGDDVDGALAAWKNEIRQVCLMAPKGQKVTTTRQPQRQRTTKTLLAAYHGLLFVCGRAFRPDIGVRIVYAMAKEGIEPNEVALKCYQSGKRLRQQLSGATSGSDIVHKFLFVDQYESLLYVECTKYDRNDRRRFGEQRVRIIV
jgi:hypothetical protein